MIQRLHICIRGVVQGVGFRPFLHRLLASENLAGEIRNLSDGVDLEAEGSSSRLESLLLRIEREQPRLARITGMEPTWLAPRGLEGIRFLPSRESSGQEKGIVLPDIATCPECLQEILNPQERRFNYPFTNCTNCGPRYSIIRSLPYDRERTTMEEFDMCAECRKEYETPDDRRFHAQPVACPRCGPSLEACLPSGTQLACGREADDITRILELAASCLNEGKTLAIMGLGGMQLIADAENESAVSRLRQRKARDAKPFAVMVENIEKARSLANVSPLEERLLRSPEAPIVLLSPSVPHIQPLASSVLEGSPWIGLMLPTTPLHHLLSRRMKRPLVATSGNLSHEPMCITKKEALSKLGGIADIFIFHNRKILRPVDDSVARVVNGRELILRRARGYAPLPVGQVRSSSSPDILATGAQLKNSIGWHACGRSVLTQHIGDLDDLSSMKTWETARSDTEMLIGASPSIIAIDAHPDYLPSQRGAMEARQNGIPCMPVQHHVAHILACIEENEAPLPLLGIAWDGTGLGEDETIWGGEWLYMKPGGWERAGHLRPFLLPGGDAAVKDPRRIALSLLEQFPESFCPSLRKRVDSSFSPNEKETLRLIMGKGINSPQTTSMGRLFDAISFFLGFDGPIRAEAEASIRLEAMALSCDCPASSTAHFGISMKKEAPFIIDWAPWLEYLDSLIEEGISPSRCAREFHHALAEIIVTTALNSGIMKLAASGGCFQNTLLLQLLEAAAKREGITLYLPQRVPPNDGGIALGQISAVLRQYPAFSSHVSRSTR